MTRRAEKLAVFRERVAATLGLWFEDSRRDFLAEVLAERCRSRGLDGESYLRGLDGPAANSEWRVLAERLTVGETYFFRGEDHFRAFVGVVMPDSVRRSPVGGTLRFLSAGCSTGDEAHSIAILLKENPALLGGRSVEILGIDINREALEKARAGRYSTWSLRETPPTVRQKYFEAAAGWNLSPEIRAMVSFREGNLASAEADLGPAGAFDAIFCRNMLMYLAPERAAAAVERFYRALRPGGFLFLGHAETLRGLSESFQLRRHEGAFYYQRPAEEDADSEPGRPAMDRPTLGWAERIELSASRIAGLGTARQRRSSPDGSREPASPPNLAPVLDLHRQERFSEALGHLDRLTDPATKNADARTLRAVLLLGCGDFAEAESLCRSPEAPGGPDAGAHYVTALCREHAGDLAAAERHAATSVHLDPTFAMPRFHLGRLLSRRGRTSEACAHFDAALTAFAKEDAARLLLFGGGFSRDALRELCRAEIRRLKTT